MKKAILILSLALLLSGCGNAAEQPAELQTQPAPASPTETAAPTEMSVPEQTVEAVQEPLLPDPTEDTAELSYAAYQVVYNVLTEDSLESAVFQGIAPDGALAWTYETGSYPMAQLPAITPVGSFEDRYYLIENGMVVALDMCSGQILFRNTDFMGSPAPEAMLIDDYGYLYLSGYDSPDFFAMDPQGSTVKRIPSLSEDYCMPFEIQQEGDQLIVYMESDQQGGSGRFPCYVPMDWLPQAQG